MNVLKKHDLDLINKIGIARKGKGNKDRLFKLTDSVINDIVDSNSHYLFYSNYNINKHITVRTAQEVLKAAAKLAKIKKRVYPHLLRHSFAIHLIEQDVNITLVQKLLGHSSIKTTQHYTNSSRIIINKVPDLI